MEEKKANVILHGRKRGRDEEDSVKLALGSSRAEED